MTDAGVRELLFIFSAMAFLLVFAIVAVVVFVRTWRKEHKKQ